MALAAISCVALLSAQEITYRLESPHSLSRFSSAQLDVLRKLNHADAAHLPRLRRLIVPKSWSSDELAYSPLPQEVPELSGEQKSVVVDLAGQVFGAYESGKLVRWGPVSSGDRHHQTPSGSYHLNWRARVHVSSENPTWIMPWYFNFANDLGLALHEYELPGRPASHGCIRLLQTDAKWFFEWGEGWTLDENTLETIRPGSLVLVLGSYDFSAPQPWTRPEWWNRGIQIPELKLEALR
jgi:hypothetical protein